MHLEPRTANIMSLLERIYYFHARLRANRYPNSGDLVREFEISPATAHRDIAYLRDRLLAPLDFSQQKNGYFYTDSDFRLPFEDTPSLVLLLGMLQKMGAETGLAELPELKQLQKKLASIVSPDRQTIDDLVHCEWIETEQVDANVFGTVLNGLLSRTRLKINYRAPAGKGSERTIEPLKLVNYQGRWYILAWCHMRRARRMFHVARISRAERTDEKNRQNLLPEDDWLSGSFGIFKGEARSRYRAEILLTGTAAEIVRHQHWHPDQQVEETKEGLLLSLPVADNRELMMKVLQFGAQAIILQPESLRMKVAAEIKNMAQRYTIDLK